LLVWVENCLGVVNDIFGPDIAERA
jgi:hypothetical protein